MLKLTAGQVAEFDPTAAGWTADILIRLSDFPEIDGRPMVLQRDAYRRGNERLVIEWDRDWTILALSRNGHWVQQELDWSLVRTLIQDEYPMTDVKVTNAPGYADFEGQLLLEPDDWPFVVVGFEREGKRAAAVVPRSTVTKIER